MQPTVALFVQTHSKSPGGRHDAARKFWASVLPVDSDQTTPEEQSDQDLYCLL